MESNSKALAVLSIRQPALVVRKGQQLSSFAQLRAMTVRRPAAAGFSPVAGRRKRQHDGARRDNADPSGLGNTLGWAWAWPLNRRILYNRASADRRVSLGPETSATEMGRRKMGRMGYSDYSAAAPGNDVGPFIMQSEGMGRLFAIDKMAEGPFPEHYEPFETPLGTNPLRRRYL